VTVGRDALRAVVARRFERSTALPTRFFAAHADAVSRACQAMAARFARGGRLLVLGRGAAASDAQHVAVEFVHPILVGKRALPAVALGADDHALATLGRPQDIALAITHGARDEGFRAALGAARARGLLTIALGVQGDAADRADFVFDVSAPDPFVAQEIHETLYHVLWELVHVFLDAVVPANAGCEPDADGHCALCGDDAEQGVVLETSRTGRTATVQLGTERRTVAIDLVDHVAAGDTVLVHQGFAIARLEEA
jgi:D-sedoheptulose 7-phosphate isomerase